MLLGIDYGEKRIGLATGDLETKIASPFLIVENDKRESVLKKIKDVCEENEIEKILERSENLTLAASRLIEKAKIKGSHDNITVLLVHYPPYERTDLSRQQRYDASRPASIAGDAHRSERPAVESL